jgi:hypothetical protein
MNDNNEGKPCLDLQDMEAAVSLRHEENRRDIKDLRRTEQATLLRLIKLEERLKPYFDNGQPGLWTRMDKRLYAIEMKLAGFGGGKQLLVWLLAVIIAPLLVVVLEKVWK